MIAEVNTADADGAIDSRAASEVQATADAEDVLGTVSVKNP
jgi:hypothetical protein